MSGMVYIVMGGQYGSEAKGSFVAYLAQQLFQHGRLGGVVRTGGPNAGHTMTLSGGTYKMRQIPCAWHLPGVPLFIGPGSLINPEVLEEELAMTGTLNLSVDFNAVIITEEDKEAEVEAGLKERVGSTREGIGAARANHAMRTATTALFDQKHRLDHYLVDVAEELHQILQDGKDVIIESTQGFGLSLIHSGYYPQTTSRDITPGQILNDAGLPTRIPHRVLVVIRTFPIRVAGNSGPMSGGEVTWDELGEKTGGYIKPEFTTVTKLQRRIAHYSSDDIRRMSLLCRPDAVCLTFLDYLNPKLAGELDLDVIEKDKAVREFISKVSQDSQAPVRWVSTGPGKITDRDPEMAFGMVSGISQGSMGAQQQARKNNG